MKPIAIFRHLKCEGPGYLAEFLAANSLEYSLIRVDQSEKIPESISNFSALVFMGGPMSVNDDLPWIDKELSLIQQAAQAKMPVLGHCLGGQLICKALGGSISANPVKEIGWHEVEVLDNSIAQDWFDALPNKFNVFHWHGETFSIPQGATSILKSAYCTNQAFVLDNILALQCHVEMTNEMIVEWAEEYADELTNTSPSVQSADSIIDNSADKTRALNRIADVIYQHWAKPLLA